MFTKMAIILALMASLTGTPAEDHEIYMRGMKVIELNYTEDLVTCVDSVGFTWQFYGCEDYCEGDIVSCLMDTMGTTDTIFDDAILTVSYTGYWVE